MALLDVSAIVADPMFASDFELLHRALAPDGYGGGVPRITRREFLTGTVVPANPKLLQRREDGSYAERGIEVFAQGRITHRPPADVVVFDGESYLVTMAESYSAFGDGFWHAVAELMTADIGEG